MDFSGVLQGVLSNALYAVLILGGGVVLVLIRTWWPDLAPKVLYGVVGVTCMAIVLYALTGHGLFSKQPPRITSDNVEEYVRKWADTLGLGVTRAPAIPAASFGVIITLKSGNPITVMRSNDIPDYLQFQIQLALSEEHQAAFAKMTKEQTKTVMEEVILELARAKIGNTILQSPMSPQSEAVILMKGEPVEGLTKDKFVHDVDDMDSAVALLRAITALAIEHAQTVTLRTQ
jgi:hypothetical protein